MSILKKQGMNDLSYHKCLNELLNFQNTNIESSVREWLEKHYKISNDLLEKTGWNNSMPISSDPIESLFSKYKRFQKRSPEGDPTRVVAILPLLVGDDNPEEINRYLLLTNQKDAKKWISENIPENIHKKKRRSSPKMKNKKVTKSELNFIHTKNPYQLGMTG